MLYCPKQKFVCDVSKFWLIATKSFLFDNCFQMYRLKVLTFDVYNTLIRVSGSPSHQYAKVANSFGIDMPEAEIERVYQKTWRQKV